MKVAAQTRTCVARAELYLPVLSARSNGTGRNCSARATHMPCLHRGLNGYKLLIKINTGSRRGANLTDRPNVAALSDEMKCGRAIFISGQSTHPRVLHKKKPGGRGPARFLPSLHRRRSKAPAVSGLRTPPGSSRRCCCCWCRGSRSALNLALSRSYHSTGSSHCSSGCSS